MLALFVLLIINTCKSFIGSSKSLFI